MRIPVNQPYEITTTFGVPDSNALFGKHSGVDLAVPLNRPVFAPAAGQLTNIQSKTGGNMVAIFDGRYYHRLMHNNSFSRGNGPVNEGEEVARAGTTGLSTGVHCHWDVNTQGIFPTSFGAFVDPLSLINQGEDIMNSGDVKNMYDAVLFRPATDDEVSAWRGKSAKDLFYTLYNSQEYKDLRFNAEVNHGDLVNFFEPLLGHGPTKDDDDAWVGQFWKIFAYNKVLIEIKNREK